MEFPLFAVCSRRLACAFSLSLPEKLIGGPVVLAHVKGASKSNLRDVQPLKYSTTTWL